MTQRIFNLDNQQDVDDLLAPYPDEFKYVYKGKSSSILTITGELVRDSNNFLMAKGSVLDLRYIKYTTTKDLTKEYLTRSIDWEQYKGKLVWFYDTIESLGSADYLSYNDTLHKGYVSRSGYRWAKFEPLKEVDYSITPSEELVK